MPLHRQLMIIRTGSRSANIDSLRIAGAGIVAVAFHPLHCGPPLRPGVEHAIEEPIVDLVNHGQTEARTSARPLPGALC